MNEFKNGRECVQDAHRAGRTVTATDSYNTEHLKRLLKSDRRITCKEMAQELEISVGSVNTILRNHLKMRKVSARWVPHRLTSDQSAEWHTPSSPRPAKYRRTQSKLKISIIFAYASHGILTSHKLESGKTINGKYYEEYINKKKKKKKKQKKKKNKKKKQKKKNKKKKKKH